MCTSSIIYILYLPIWGGILTCSVRFRISSTELFDAASSSWILKALDSLKDRQDSQALQGSDSGPGSVQLMVFAKIRAQVVFPTPRGPQNKYACPRWFFRIAFLSVPVMGACPTTEAKVSGRYFRAETIKLSMRLKLLKPSIASKVFLFCAFRKSF